MVGNFFNVLICIISICFDLKPTLDDEMPNELEDSVQQGYFTELVRLEKGNYYFRKTHIVFVCSHKYFILNNYSSISPNSTLVCFQIYSSLTISQIFHLKILVGVAAYAAIPVSQLSPLVQAEPSHKMCHLHIKAISHCSLSLNPQCHNTHSKST